MPATTRATLRQMVGRKLGDLRQVTASAAGTTTTLTDSLSLTDSDNAYLGNELVFTGGTAANLGQVQRSVGSQQTAATITFTPGLPAPTAVGDTADMVNLRGIGWRAQQYHEAINDVLRMAAPDWLTKRLEYLGTFSSDAPTLALPPSLSHVYRLEYQDELGDWREIPRAKRPGVFGQGWVVDPVEGLFGVQGRFRDLADGYAVRAWGYGAADTLNGDGDSTTISASWLVSQAAALLAFARGERDWVAKGQSWMQEAHDEHPRGSTALAPGTIKVTVT